MSTLEMLRMRREEILAAARRHGATDVRVFGSVARAEDGATSDVDLLVEATPSTSSWFPAGLVLELEVLIGRRVEIVTAKGLHASLRDRVLREAVPL